MIYSGMCVLYNFIAGVLYIYAPVAAGQKPDVFHQWNDSDSDA